MPIFSLKSDILSQVKEKPFKLESEIQHLVEANLQHFLGLDFVKSEFTISGSIQELRIDTLAFDPQSKAFVIIEYKRGKNFSVVDQGVAYLAVMLNNKSDFILEYNENCDKTLRKADVDWSQSRVIFISQDFTTYQQEAINFKNLAISLWKIKRYSNNTISFDEIKRLNPTATLNFGTTDNNSLEVVNREIVVYTENDRLNGIPEDIRALYDQLREIIMELGDVEIKATKLYIAFTVNGSNFADVALQKKRLKIWINLFKGELEDPYEMARDVSNIGHHGNGDYEIQANSAEKLDYILSLIKQAYKKKL